MSTDNNKYKDCEGRSQSKTRFASSLALASRCQENGRRGGDRLLDSAPEPVHVVNFVIFDGGFQWEAAVKFFEQPTDLMREAIEMAYEVVQEAKSADTEG